MTRFTTVRTRLAVATIVVCVLAAVSEAEGQELKIGIIDFYGLSRVSTEQVRAALTFKEGDTIVMAVDQRPGFMTTSEARLSTLPGVARARIQSVCCDQGRAIVFVGIEERSAATLRFRAAPQGSARLAADIVQSYEELSKAFMLAVRRGDAAEDWSQGHALAHDPATRAIQERFVTYARRDLSQLRLVLRSSSDAAQRALAAQVLGYATDKQDAVDDLVQGMSDPSEEVRNNAMRALSVFGNIVPGVSGSTPRIPAEPFIDLLNSLVWSDRNKSSMALMTLSASQDSALLAKLRERALTPLIEIARWKSTGHALLGFLILGRIAGYTDEAANDLWARGNREVVIEAASKRN